MPIIGSLRKKIERLVPLRGYFPAEIVPIHIELRPGRKGNGLLRRRRACLEDRGVLLLMRGGFAGHWSIPLKTNVVYGDNQCNLPGRG